MWRDETVNPRLRDRISAGVLMEAQAAGGGIMAAQTLTQSDRNVCIPLVSQLC